MRDFATLGDKLGPKIARLVSQAVIATKRGLGPHEVRVRAQASQEVIDAAGREVAEHYRPLIRKMLDIGGSEISPEVRAFLEDAISGEHQLKAIGGLLMGPVSSSLGTFLSNELAPFVYQIVGSNPHLDLDPQTASNAAAQRIVTDSDAASTVAQQGYSNGPYQVLKELAYAYLSPADALDLWRRNLISEQQFVLCLERSAVPPAFIQALVKSKTVPLPADLAALAVLRGAMTQADGEAIAAQSGVSASDFAIMVEDTGEPPGLEQLDEAYRRGFVDKARLERGIRQSRVRNEWIDVIEALRFSPMSVADAVNGVVQNHLDAAKAAQIAEQNGLEAGAVDTLIANAGEPLSRTEMEQLYNRGKVTRDDVLQALRESRLKDKYGIDAFELHVRLLEPRMLSSAVEYGAISHADAVKRAMQYGFSAEDAAILVNEGSARKLQSYKRQVVTAAEGLYEQSAISDAQLKVIARSNGFDESEADFLVSAADYRRKERSLAAVVSAIRSKYVGHHIESGVASGLLDSAGVPADRRDYLIGLWDIEESANVRKLTPAQVVKAFTKKMITPEDAMKRLTDDGYSEVDAALLLEGA